MGANVLVEFENVFLIEGIFFKLGAKDNFGIEKISYFGNYMDPCNYNSANPPVIQPFPHQMNNIQGKNN